MRKKCEKCNGKGYLYPDLSLNLPVTKCNLCNGTGAPAECVEPQIYRDTEEEQLKGENERQALLLCFSMGLFTCVLLAVISFISQRHDLLLVIFGK